MPRGPAGHQHHPGCRCVGPAPCHRPSPGTRSQTSGWPSWTRSPGGRPASAPPGRRRACAPRPRPPGPPGRPRRGDRRGDRTGTVGRPAVPGNRPVPGAARASSGAKMPAAGAHHDPFGHVEVLALVGVGSARHDSGPATVSISVSRSVGHGDRHRPQVGDGASGQAGEHAPRAQLGQEGGAPAGQGLEGLAPADRAAQLGREQARPLGRVGVDPGVDVGHDRHLGGEERGVAQGLAQGRAGRRP